MRIEVLTPLHIGDGEEIIPWEYEVERGGLKVYPVEHIIDQLTKIYSGQRLRNLLLELRNSVKDFGFSRHLGDFIRDKGISLKPLYTLECKTRLKDKEFKSVKSHIKSLEGVYIPGSEVKGTLRGIFIFGVVREALKRGDNKHLSFIVRRMERALRESSRDGKAWEKAFRDIENYFFRDRERKDAKYDLFKAIRVSDSKARDPGDVLYVDSVRLVGSERNFLEPHELIRPGTEFDLRIDIDEERKKALKKESDNPNIDKLTLEFLHESASSFYNFLISEDYKFFKRHNTDRAVEELAYLEGVRKGGGFLLRLGKHQGFLSTTIMLMVKKSNPELYRNVYRKIVPRTGREPNKTRKITGSGSVLGWCRLS